MSDIVISVDDLSKCYFVGHESVRRNGPGSFRETLARQAAALARKTIDMARGRPIIDGDEVNEFWALKDVSFEVKRGEVVGIIGRNGAGKSTLLKILSRITEPTRGRIKIDGRLASLLEVGTGFHPELTGRENIFLNGAILGMTKKEIRAKFDEIVEFSEIETFLDTPVKRYSSGMYVRLAFAVAAHLEPEILLVDEVLSVGDVEFQKKCLGKMGEVEKEGRTVLFVTHQMAAMQNVCNSAMMLAGGRIAFRGNTRETLSAYLANSSQTAAIPIASRTDRSGSGTIRFSRVRCRSGNEEQRNTFTCGDTAILELHFENKSCEDLHFVTIAIGIDDHYGQRRIYLYSDLVNQNFKIIPAHVTCVEVEIPRLPIPPGRYGFTLHATVNGALADWIRNAGWFDVEQGDFYGTGKLPPADQGSVLVQHRFRLQQ